MPKGLPVVQRVTRRRALVAGFAACAAAWARPAAAREPVWIDQRRLGPFVCRATFPLGDRLVAETSLHRLQEDLVRSLSLSPCQEEIEILLMSDASQHKRLIASRHPEAPYRRALFYKRAGRGVIYAYLHRELPVDLRHEGTHALLHADLPMVPLWLDEGLAEYFENPSHRRAGGADHLKRIYRDLGAGRMLSLEQLERKHELTQMSEVDYRYAWAWAHFLLHGPSVAKQQLADYLATLRRMEPPGLMSERLAAVIPNPEKQFAAHFWRWPAALRAAAGASTRR